MKIVPTPSQTAGPFFAVGMTDEKNCVQRIAGPNAKGERVFLTIQLFDGDGAPVPDAMIEIWQADAAGKYNHPEDAHCAEADTNCRGFGRMGTDDNGSCEFETIKPGRVPGIDDALQAPHLNVAVFGRGLLKQLYTRIYFADDPANGEDPTLKILSDDRRETLMARKNEGNGRWTSYIRLQGEQETVFFDV